MSSIIYKASLCSPFAGCSVFFHLTFSFPKNLPLPHSNSMNIFTRSRYFGFASPRSIGFFLCLSDTLEVNRPGGYYQEDPLREDMDGKPLMVNRDSAHLLILACGTIYPYLQGVSSIVISRTPQTLP